MYFGNGPRLYVLIRILSYVISLKSNVMKGFVIVALHCFMIEFMNFDPPKYSFLKYTFNLMDLNKNIAFYWS